jgi:hypothetical protein
MLLATHVNVATCAQDVQAQTSKHRESHNNFPHTISFKKKALRMGEPENCPG